MLCTCCCTCCCTRRAKILDAAKLVAAPYCFKQAHAEQFVDGLSERQGSAGGSSAGAAAQPSIAAGTAAATTGATTNQADGKVARVFAGEISTEGMDVKNFVHVACCKLRTTGEQWCATKERKGEQLKELQQIICETYNVTEVEALHKIRNKCHKLIRKDKQEAEADEEGGANLLGDKEVMEAFEGVIAAATELVQVASKLEDIKAAFEHIGLTPAAQDEAIVVLKAEKEIERTLDAVQPLAMSLEVYAAVLAARQPPHVDLTLEDEVPAAAAAAADETAGASTSGGSAAQPGSNSATLHPSSAAAGISAAEALAATAADPQPAAAPTPVTASGTGRVTQSGKQQQDNSSKAAGSSSKAAGSKAIGRKAAGSGSKAVGSNEAITTGDSSAAGEDASGSPAAAGPELPAASAVDPLAAVVAAAQQVGAGKAGKRTASQQATPLSSPATQGLQKQSKQQGQLSAGTSARASLTVLRTRTSYATYAVGEKQYKFADNHSMFLSWQAVSLGKSFTSMGVVESVLLMGVVEGSSQAIVVAVAVPCFVTDFTASHAAFVIKATKPGLAGMKVKAVTGDHITSKQLTALCSLGSAVEDWPLVGVLLYQPGNKGGTRQHMTPQQCITEFLQ